MAESTLHFARISFDVKITHFEDKDKIKSHRKDVLLKVIDFNTPIKKLLARIGKTTHLKKFDWHFAGIKANEDYIYGKLGKERGKTKLTLDEIKKDYIQNTITDANVVFFLIDLNKNVLVFELKKDVGAIAPVEILMDVFNAYYDDKEKIVIQPITDKREIINRIKKLTRINTIHLNISPTNPDSTSGSDEMDKFLRAGNIKRMSIEAFSYENGIKLDNVPLIKSGFHLAEEGYGSAKATGKMGTSHEEIITGNIPITSNVNLVPSDDELNIKILLKQIKMILERMEQKQNV
jgi:hypothetical protein